MVCLMAPIATEDRFDAHVKHLRLGHRSPERGGFRRRMAVTAFPPSGESAARAQLRDWPTWRWRSWEATQSAQAFPAPASTSREARVGRARLLHRSGATGGV